MELNTFSIVARCVRTGRLGGAVSTAVPAVGAICLFGEPGVGFVATQSWVNPYLGLSVLESLRHGAEADAALGRAMDGDAGRALRQVGVVDAAGRSAAWTGAECTRWCGHRSGTDYAVQGNMLTGADVVAGMEAALLASADEDLAERLMRALEAGQAAGGDKRGKQSAALKVYDREAYPWLDLRVDEHAAPVAELRRVLGIATVQLRPFIAAMPDRAGSAAPMPDAVTSMLALPPPQRPGGGGSGPDQ